MNKALSEAWGKLKADLEWRGPNDKKMGHVFLPRLLAEALLEQFECGEIQAMGKVKDRAFVRLRDIKEGDELEIGEGFICMSRGSRRVVQETKVGEEKPCQYYVICIPELPSVRHYLSTSLDDQGRLTGFYKL